MFPVIDTYHRLKTVKTVPTMAFYNTINLSGPALERAQAKTLKQKQLVAALFRNNPTTRFSASQIHTLFRAKYGRKDPITSWRRTLTDLTSDGVLIKGSIKQQVLGPNGSPENTWVYNEAGDTKALQSFLDDLQSGKLEDRPTVSQHPSAAPIPMHCEPKGFVQLQMFL
jgi:hypothetical protein